MGTEARHDAVLRCKAVQEGRRLHFLADRADISGALMRRRRYVWIKHFR